MATWNSLSLSYTKDLALQNTGVTYKHVFTIAVVKFKAVFPLEHEGFKNQGE